MAKDLNKCMFIGRLGQAPETTYMPNGNAVTKISLACGDDYKDKQTGQKVEQTNWIRVVAFGRLAEVMAQYCKQGSRIYLEGKQVTRKYQAQDGTDRYSTEIVADNMQLLDSPQGGQQQGQPQQNQQRAPQPQQNRQPAQQYSHAPPPSDFDGFDDDIPFN